MLSEFLKEGKERKIKKICSMHQLCLKYKDADCENFLVNASYLITKNTLMEIEKLTRDQSQNNLWFELRYGRITASKAYSVSKCKTPDESLIAQIMGGKIPDTPAMSRGRKLEDAVRKIVEIKLGMKIEKCGLMISQEYLMIAGSPDGISDEFVIEIKCPTSAYNYKNYVQEEQPTKIYYAQVQLQMFLSDKKKCYFCVADSNYESNENVNKICVHFDSD